MHLKISTEFQHIICCILDSTEETDLSIIPDVALFFNKTTYHETNGTARQNSTKNILFQVLLCLWVSDQRFAIVLGVRTCLLWRIMAVQMFPVSLLVSKHKCHIRTRRRLLTSPHGFKTWTPNSNLPEGQSFLHCIFLFFSALNCELLDLQSIYIFICNLFRCPFKSCYFLHLPTFFFIYCVCLSGIYYYYFYYYFCQH